MKLRKDIMKIALLQMNPTMGNLAKNTQTILNFVCKAKKEGASILVTSAFALSGYHPKDLLLSQHFHQALNKQLEELKKHTQDFTLVVGHPIQIANQLFNTATIIQNGQFIHQYHQISPTHDKNNDPYFTQGKHPTVFEHSQLRIGILLGEDYHSETIINKTLDLKPHVIVSMNASPFVIDQRQKKLEIIKRQADQHHIPIAYINLVGGQDEYLLDGGSFALNSQGQIVAQAPFYEESLLVVDITKNDFVCGLMATVPSRLESIYQALALSIKDYVTKNNFTEVLIGLSGGIDSALTLAIARDALGHNKIKTVMMPSCYTSPVSLACAKQLAHNMGALHSHMDIWPIYQTIVATLKSEFAGQKEDTAEENIQARIRGMLLMALANKNKSLVLATGNKSELAVGYCTIYGDMVGGFAVLKDISKTLVYELANWRNSKEEIIPLEIINRAPSAELKPNQTDQDHLPSYEVLDAIMKCYMQEHASIEAIIAKGFLASDVKKVIAQLIKNEYKRQQGPIGPCITTYAFGKNWHYPITNHFV